MARLLVERSDASGLAAFTAPRIARHESRTFLALSKVGMGTSSPDLSEYYQWSARKLRWDPIAFDGDRLQRELERSVPGGMMQNGCGFGPNPRDMVLESGLKHYDDPHCDATEGHLRARLTVRRNRFEIASVTYEPN